MRVFLFLFFFIFTKVCLSQTVSSPNRSDLLIFEGKYPVEKVFVHLSSAVIVDNQDIFFTCFATMGSDNKPSNISETMYVDVLSKSRGRISTLKVKLEGGKGYGKIDNKIFDVDEDYFLTAYTAYSLDFGEEFLFSEKLFYAKKSYLPKPTITNNSRFTQSSLNYSFLAEWKGLEIFESFNFYFEVILSKSDSIFYRYNQKFTKTNINIDFSLNRAAFYPDLLTINIKDKDANLIQCSELYLPLLNNDIIVFNKSVSVSDSLIRHVVFFKDIKNVDFGESYFIVGDSLYVPETVPELNYCYIDLPEEYRSFDFSIRSLYDQEPFRLKINTLDKPVSIVFNQISNQLDISFSVKNRDQVPIFIEVRSGNKRQIYFKHNSDTIINLKKDNLQIGLNALNVYDSDGDLLDFRYFYVPPMDKGNVLLNKVLSFQDDNYYVSFNGLSEELYFISMSILTRFNQSIQSQSFVSSSLISSNFKNSIFNYGGYLDSEDPSSHRNINNSLLYFEYNDYLYNKQLERDVKPIAKPKLSYDFQMPVLKKLLKSDFPISLIFFSDLHSSSAVVDPNADGTFSISGLDFYDSVNVVISHRKVDLANVEVSISNIIYDFDLIMDRRGYQLINYDLVHPLRKYNGDTLKFVDLDEFTVSSYNFSDFQNRNYLPGDVTISTSNILGSESFLTVYELLAAKVPGAKITTNGADEGFISIRNNGTLEIDPVTGSAILYPPLFLLDDMPFDPSFVRFLKVSDLESIEVYKDPASISQFGVVGASGVVAMYSKKGFSINNITNTPVKLNSQLSISGYYDNRLLKPFYLFNDPFLFWKSLGIVNESFFLPKGEFYTLVLNGFDKEGNIVSKMLNLR
ncbi:TonB-dependent receptor [Penaeicola halotolerans]|uniref:TonB-dependent receptor n=1 Tax=Penaeicola halotolerans TaxID=2793196 RepID=UPI001CF8821B|nr:TonB-dependent receptor plug domain-containing protein [Penaeicola halotolerans]